MTRLLAALALCALVLTTSIALAPTSAFAAQKSTSSANGSLFIDDADDSTGTRVDAITEPTYEPNVLPAPEGYPEQTETDVNNLAEVSDSAPIDYEDLTDEEQASINRVKEQNTLLRNAAAIVAFFSVLGAGITFVNFRMELI